MFFIINNNFKDGKGYNSQAFIKSLINIINKEFIYFKYNLTNKNSIKYNLSE